MTTHAYCGPWYPKGRRLGPAKERTLRTRLRILYPGILPFGDGYALQQRTAEAVRAGGPPTLILLEHPPTFTLGARGDEGNLLTGSARLAKLGADVIRTDRGGDVTFHGPGQIVGYAIVDLRRLGIGVSDYVFRLEHALIETLAVFDIQAVRDVRGRGVWTDGAKIAAIGVHVSRGITTHGFALNVTTDLSWYDHIVPCGLAGVRVTSMAAATGRLFAIGAVHEVLVARLSSTFELASAELMGVPV